MAGSQDDWLYYGNKTAPPPPDPEDQPGDDPNQGPGGPDDLGPRLPPNDPGMASWSASFWQKMIDTLGLQKSTIPGEGEFFRDKYGRMPMDPKWNTYRAGTGWDTSEVWKTGSPESGYKDRYAEGEVPDWMQSALSRFTDMKAAGALNQTDLDMLASHWIRGVGMNPVWESAFKARPEWVSNYLREFFRGLGANV